MSKNQRLFERNEKQYKKSIVVITSSQTLISSYPKIIKGELRFWNLFPKNLFILKDWYPEIISTAFFPKANIFFLSNSYLKYFH